MSTKNGTQPTTPQPTPPAAAKPLSGPVLCRQIKGQDIDPAHIRERTVAIYNAEAGGLQRHDVAARVSVALYYDGEQGLTGLVILDAPQGDDVSEVRALSLAVRTLGERLAVASERSMASLAENPDILEKDVAIIMMDCYHCGLLGEQAPLEQCPHCGALAVELSLFFYKLRTQFV